jgi:hypothetical protein
MSKVEFPIDLELFNEKASDEHTFSKQGFEDFFATITQALGASVSHSIASGVTPNKLRLIGKIVLERVE